MLINLTTSGARRKIIPAGGYLIKMSSVRKICLTAAVMTVGVAGFVHHGRPVVAKTWCSLSVDGNRLDNLFSGLRPDRDLLRRLAQVQADFPKCLRPSKL